MSGKKTIVTLLRVSLLACPLLFTTPSFAMIDTPSVKVGFSPEGSAAKWHLNRSQFGIRIDHDLAFISDHSLASQSITIWHASDH